jgi:MYXO-CTERM domain-containing protein
VLGIVVLLVALRQDGTARSLLRGFLVTAVTFGILFANPRSPWYLLTMVAVVAVVPDWRAVAVIGSLCLGSFVFTSWRSATNPEFQLPELVDVPSPTVFAVPLALLGLIVAALWLRRRRAEARVESQ